jgi:hypothetical protein
VTTHCLADPFGDGIDGASAVNRCEQLSRRIIVDERLRTFPVHLESFVHRVDTIIDALDERSTAAITTP